MNILVVEDNKVVSLSVQARIRKSGRCSVVACDAQEAINYLDVHHPDLILMDIDLPDMDGISLTQLIRKKLGHKWIPILFHSTRDDKESIKNARLAGGDGYFVKPGNMDKILQTIEETEPLIDVLKSYDLW